jgi:hypothetical protein
MPPLNGRKPAAALHRLLAGVEREPSSLAKTSTVAGEAVRRHLIPIVLNPRSGSYRVRIFHIPRSLSVLSHFLNLDPRTAAMGKPPDSK